MKRWIVSCMLALLAVTSVVTVAFADQKPIWVERDTTVRPMEELPIWKW